MFPCKLRITIFCAVLIAFPSALMAQVYPAFFFPPSEQSSVQLDQGISAAQVPNGNYLNPVVAVSASNGRLSYAILPDGVNVAYSQPIVDVPNINCHANTPSTCSASIALYNGNIYIAYSDASTLGLDIVQATPVPGNVGYMFTLIYQDNSVALTTSPSLAVFGSNLEVLFGTTNANHIYYETYNGSSWSGANTTGNGLDIASGSQPGVAVLGSNLYIAVQANNSGHQFYVFATPDMVNYSQTAVPSGFASAGGITMVNYNGSLVAAVQQNNSNHVLFVFSSRDGVNWGLQEYSSTIALGATGGLSLFDGDLSLVFKQNNSQNNLFTTQASH